MKKITLSFLALAASVMMASAQAPAKFNYQGIARNASGAPLASKPLGMRISVRDLSPTGTVVYQETQNTVTNAYGLYNVTIGGGTPTVGTLAGVAWGTGDKYIQVEVDPAGGTSYVDLGASQLLSVPYALNAGSGGGGGGSISGTVNTIPKFSTATALGNSQIKDDGTYVSINTPTPSAKLHVSGSTNTSVTLGGLSFGSQALIVNNGTTATSAGTNAIIGYASNSTVENHGVFGLGGATTGGSSSNIGGFFVGYPGTTSTGNSIGVYANATGGANNISVFGQTTAGGTGILAGYFNGNVNVVGVLAKSAGTFKIDHPLDPANKYLYHSFVESPDMMNIYNGNITTDARGFATVTLPDYFEALNKDFRYQLTVIGTFAQAIVKEKVSDNHFVIQTSQPNVEVSWMVTGVRHDKFADAHRVVPEVEKEPAFKGLYLNAREFDQPETKSISHALMPNDVLQKAVDAKK